MFCCLVTLRTFSEQQQVNNKKVRQSFAPWERIDTAERGRGEEREVDKGKEPIYRYCQQRVMQDRISVKLH